MDAKDIRFELVTLCSRFHRRGAAFVRSLLQQELVPRTIIYSDVDTSMAVMLALPMQRPSNGWGSLYFITTSDTRSRSDIYRWHLIHAKTTHLIYCDCDLWFPKGFFQAYAEALAAKPRGYWGAWVRIVSVHAAERLLASGALDDGAIAAAAGLGFRYGQMKGCVGSFQCVPVGLCPYPEYQGALVGGGDKAFAEDAVKASESKDEERRIGPECYHLGHPNYHNGVPEGESL